MERPEDDPGTRLRRMRRRATGLLVSAAAVFLAARLFEARLPWLGPVRAAAEASMVGGIADWFAVTALFRRPFGLPIPHTAIIPLRKDAIGKALGDFVKHNFLSREVVEPGLAGLRLGERTASWLADPGNARRVARHVAAGLVGAALVVRDEDFEAAVNRGLVQWLGAVRVTPLVASILGFVTEGGRHHELLNALVSTLARAVEENEDLIRERVRAESPWWLPERVDDRIHARIVSGLKRTLADLAADPDHPLRKRYDEAFRRLVRDLQRSPEAAARLEGLKTALLELPELRRFSASLWQDLRRSLADSAEHGERKSTEAIAGALSALARAVLADPGLIAKVDGWFALAALYALEQGRNHFGDLIARTVAQWDAQATSRRIELQIGSDLQYIRINGALVGGLVGLALYAVSALL